MPRVPPASRQRRKKGDQPIETENVRVLGEGRYEMSVRNKGTLGSSVIAASKASSLNRRPLKTTGPVFVACRGTDYDENLRGRLPRRLARSRTRIRAFSTAVRRSKSVSSSPRTSPP